MSQPLPADLAHALVSAEPRLAGFTRLHFIAEVDSTNDVALRLAAAGAPEGTCVLADVQRSGRGRRGRSWFSPPGAGLYLSVVIRPEGLTAPLSVVTLAAGVASADAVSTITGLPIELKWPNDLMVGRPWRKIGGLLCESAGVGARIDALVIGLGVNLRHVTYPQDIADRATSVDAELGRAVDRSPLVVEVLARFRDVIDRLRDGQREAIWAEWRALGRAGLGGASVRWHDQGGERRGLARDIAEDGALLIESEGRIERLIAGEVTWERLRQ
jgi:BirA family biotin operon repressor/biotin-[acetyl-CoA-carboxylase] ligase